MTLATERSLTSRLLAVGGGGGDARLQLRTHLAVHGPLPSTGGRWAGAIMAEIAGSGLTGRGGAGFPTARKLELLTRQRRRPLLLVNAMEGEPASLKDRVLVQRSPHLVLDGAQVAAGLIGAQRVVLCVPAEDAASTSSLRWALHQRELASLDTAPLDTGPHDTAPTTFAHPPGRYAAGEESALCDWIDGGRGVPAFRPDKGVPLVAGRSPVLVQNVETLAQVALVARHGAEWFRAVGRHGAWGTTLVTVCGDVSSPGVLEVEMGAPLRGVLEAARATSAPRAVLMGGYGGTWVDGADVDVPLAPDPLAERGASAGAGVIGVLGPGACGIAETARIVGYLAGQSAGQCGSCTFGLPALADDLARLAVGTADAGLTGRLRVRFEMVAGRGACRLPDGAVHLAASALRVFADDAHAHAGHRLCPGWNRRPLLPTPAGPGIGRPSAARRRKRRR